MSDLKSSVEDCLKRESRIHSSDKIVSMKSVGGGRINKAYLVKTATGSQYFVKQKGESTSFDKSMCVRMFQTEIDGLRGFRKINTIRVPEPICVGELSNGAFIITEAIEMRPLCNERLLGEKLAAMHLVKGPDRFGLDTDNFIGSIPQPNAWHESWVDFLRMRLEFQFKLAQLPAPLDKQANELLARLPEIFKDTEIVPSLIHGDLWSGNCAADEDGNPVIYDPAVYWGHHEAELGAMRLFGGYGKEFYSAYHSRIPKAPGFDTRGMIYELYHIVNHYNLFGNRFLGQCQNLLERILSKHVV
ncbi:hypothetical protein IW140_003936 [Coemansia sp. RSA 1813]|nr:hypothetical protein EV178_003745 [Coemansia sp. RSA 1646]KAJ1766404.1 hypothetical protein LPJ74_005903 [Coemansia sp. RSA 1843]KAJ2088587.1 hypothetical protein IW138_004077 [Coemansia sp. RSA 986]KAJ2212206.1 hypothetical protein EV179_004833 [Coemansia sp. RSA 487]KAJ2568393.1 hypothetical protein IW140_003936 [Coemansia sp. RSA 1813]